MLNSGCQTLTYTYSVTAGAKITKRSPSKVTVSVANTLFLKCEAEGVPRPLVVWIKDGEELQRGTDDTSFVHENAKKHDAGCYECIALNSAGNDSYRVEVIVKGNNLETTCCFLANKTT